MRGLNVRSLLMATAVGVFGVQMLGAASPCPPGEEKEQKVAIAVSYVQGKDVYKVVDRTINKASTIVLRADKDGRVVEVRVQPVDTSKKKYVIVADSISIADVTGKATGNLVLTTKGNIVFEVTATKKAPSVQIGLVTETVSKALAGHLKIRPTEALIVTAVMEGLPAAKAGIKEYDVITHLEGTKAVTHVKLKELLSKCKPEQVIALRLLREGEPREMKVRVEAVEPKVQPLTTTYDTWRKKPTNLDAKLSLVQPQVGGVVTQIAPGRFRLTEPLRTQKFVVIDPKISTQVLEARPLTRLYEQYRNLAFADAYTRLVPVDEGESLEARLLAEIATLQQQLSKLKALIVELDATSNNEDE